jgi:hypothetical protein
MAADVRQIRDQVSRWLSGQMSLRELEDWFVPATWDNHKANNTEAEELANAIELLLSEYTDGVLSKDEFRREITEAIRPFLHDAAPSIIELDGPYLIGKSPSQKADAAVNTVVDLRGH